MWALITIIYPIAGDFTVCMLTCWSSCLTHPYNAILEHEFLQQAMVLAHIWLMRWHLLGPHLQPVPHNGLRSHTIPKGRDHGLGKEELRLHPPVLSQHRGRRLLGGNPLLCRFRHLRGKRVPTKNCATPIFSPSN